MHRYGYDACANPLVLRMDCADPMLNACASELSAAVINGSRLVQHYGNGSGSSTFMVLTLHEYSPDNSCKFKNMLFEIYENTLTGRDYVKYAGTRTKFIQKEGVYLDQSFAYVLSE